ncbi:MAG: VTT domain-containing protein [Patescibacteria group bacterium]
MHFDLKETLTFFATNYSFLVYVLLFAIVFAESGLFFGFFLPGDSLLVTAGLLASQNIMSIYILVPALTIAAISGDSVGYWFGAKFGPSLFNKDKSLLFDKKHLAHAHTFYEKHGGKTIIIARFLPIIRTFAPIVAGIAKMEYKKFLSFNLIGGILWACGALLLGYFLGRAIPDIDKHLTKIILVIIFLSFVPPLIEGYKHNKGKIFTKFMDLMGKKS